MPTEPNSQAEARRPSLVGAVVGCVLVGLCACPGAPRGAGPESSEGDRGWTLAVVDPDGEAVGGARVRLRREQARTDARGEVVLFGAPGAIVVEAPGFVRFEGEPTGGGVTLERAWDLRVQVRTGAERTALGGALVSAFALDDRGRVRSEAGEWSGHTGGDGRAELRGLPAGGVRVRVERAGYASAVRHVAGDEDEVAVVLEPACAIGVQVYGVRGNPASGAEVSIVGSGIWPPRSADTDATGRVAFDDVPPGVYELHARRDADASPPRRGVEVEVGRSAYVSLRLQRGRTLEGRVTDDAGTPLADAEVVLTETGIALVPRTTSTDEHGAFVFDAVLDGSYWVRADVPAHVPAQLPVQMAADLAPVVLALPRAARVSGVVLDARDRPVAGATVHWLGAPEAPPPISDSGSLGVTTGPVPPIPLDAFAPDDDELSVAPTPGAPVLVPSGVTATTDERGRFVLDGLRPGRGELLAEGGGYASTRSGAVELVAGEAHEHTLVMPDGYRLDGRVVDERGFPIGSVPVELRVASEPWPRGQMVNEDGTFTFPGVTGRAVVVVRAPELPAARRRLELTADASIEIRLETSLVALDVRVFDPEGFPLGSVRVDVEGLRPEAPTERSGFTEADGTLHFGALPAPPWRVRVDDPAHVPAEVLVRPEEVGVEQTILLARGGSVLGRVRDGWSRAPVIAEVRLDGGAPRATDLEGTFRFERVPFGPHQLEAAAAGYLPALVAIDLENTHQEVEVELTQGGSVRVEVVDALGEPAADAVVTLGDGIAQRTSNDGATTLAAAEGLYRLTARVERDGEIIARADAGRVEVVRGETLERRLALDARLEAPAAAGPGRFVVGVPVAVGRRGEVIAVEATYAQTALRAGDQLLRIEGERVLSAGQARAMLRGSEGDTLTVEVRRGRGARTLRVPVVRFHLP